MNPGKITCEILKKIRSEIAEANQIDYVTEPCTFKGSCIGTCPKCEAELRELEHQLAKKQGFPKTALIAGVTLSLLTGVTSCITNSNTVEQTTEIQIINTDTNNIVLNQTIDTAEIIKNLYSTFLYEKYDSLPSVPMMGAIDWDKMMFLNNPNAIPLLYDYSFYDVSRSPIFDYKNEFLGAYISKFVKFPENKIIEKKTMVVQLLIDKEGVIKDVTILKSADPEIDQQVKKIFESMPRWVPGKNPNGTSIDTRVKLRLKVTQNGITVKKLTYDEVKIIK